MVPTRYIRLSVEMARRRGIDWTARSLFFPARKETISYLEQLVKDLKEAADVRD